MRNFFSFLKQYNQDPVKRLARLARLARALAQRAGKTAFKTIITGLALAAFVLFIHAMFFGGREVGFPVSADTATTTVTVLNTAPNWSVDAYEYTESSTSTPTNAGSNVVFVAVGTDPNSENYYLLVCKTSSTPTANNGAAPTCAGGAGNQWAVSISTGSGVQATSTYTTQVADPQSNPWFAWICDGNAGGAQCNATYKNGSGTATSSPFIVNHRPNFATTTNDSPTLPGAIITWLANASDTDNFTGATDTVQLVVCKAADFTGTACGAGGTYCTSAFSLNSASCTSTIPVPTPDKTSSSYPYIIDNHNFAASGGGHGATSTYTIANAAPSITSSSISLLNTVGTSSDMILTQPAGETTGFRITFTVTDNNSCKNNANGNEVSSALPNVYRSGIGSSSCMTAGNYNPNHCYPAAIGSSTWNYFCSQDAGSCTTADTTHTWTCTFPLWYLADATDGSMSSDTVYFAENWLTSLQATDDNNATSTWTQSSNGNELDSFLAAILNTTSINYGSLSPGTGNPTLATSTRMSAIGNVGLDQTLYGTDMCSTYPSCPVSATSTIPVGQEQYASSSVVYGSGFTLLANPGALFGIHIHKSLATSTPTSSDTYWGISIPGTIQLSGGYTGQNTFIGVKSNAQTW